MLLQIFLKIKNMYLILAIFIFLELIMYIVLFDIILSWLSLMWIKRPKFVSDIIDPLYAYIKNIIPTNIWPFDLTPMIVILLIYLFKIAISLMFPELVMEALNLINLKI